MVIAIDAAVVLAGAERLLAEFPPASTDPLVFLRAQYDAGLGVGSQPGGIRRARRLDRPPAPGR